MRLASIQPGVLPWQAIGPALEDCLCGDLDAVAAEVFVEEAVDAGGQLLAAESVVGAAFVTHAYLLPRDQNDRDVVAEQTRLLQGRLQQRIRRASFERGFHAPQNQRELARIVAEPCLPMPGGHQASRQEAEATIAPRQARQRHPGIESAIGALPAGNGLSRCRDRTERGFHRYVPLGTLGRNLHVLGKLLMAGQDASSQAARSRRKRAAAKVAFVALPSPVSCSVLRPCTTAACQDRLARWKAPKPAVISPRCDHPSTSHAHLHPLPTNASPTLHRETTTFPTDTSWANSQPLIPRSQ